MSDELPMKEDVTGFINEQGVPQVRVVASGPTGQLGEMFPLLAPDFDGELSMPLDAINYLALPMVQPDVYRCVIHWARGTQSVNVIIEAEARIGKRLLGHYRVVGESAPRSPIFLEFPPS